SRRRHTRFSRDWSSDVCSSDLCYRSGSRACSCGGLCESCVQSDEKRGVVVIQCGKCAPAVTTPEVGLLREILRQSEAVVTVAHEIGRASCRERVEISVVAGW